MPLEKTHNVGVDEVLLTRGIKTRIPEEFESASLHLAERVTRPMIFAVMKATHLASQAVLNEELNVPIICGSAGVLILASYIFRFVWFSPKKACAIRWKNSLLEEGLLSEGDDLPLLNGAQTEVMAFFDHKLTIPLTGLAVSLAVSSVVDSELTSMASGFVTTVAINHLRLKTHAIVEGLEYTEWLDARKNEVKSRVPNSPNPGNLLKPGRQKKRRRKCVREARRNSRR